MYIYLCPICPKGAFCAMNKQTGINFIAQVIAFATNLCISFFLTPFIIENVGVEANGFVTLANTFVEYAQLFTVAINSMAGRFITIKIHQKNIKDANKYFTSVVFANVFLSVVFTAVISFVIVFLEKFLNISESSVADIKVLWAFVALNFIISLFASNYSVSTFVTDRLDKTALTNARGSILRALVLVLCYTFFRPYTFYVGIASVVMGFNNLISHMYFKNKLLPELRVKREYFDFACIKELISSGIWNSVTKLSAILSSGLDLLITNILVNGVAMGILNLSKTVSNLVLSLFGMLSSIFAPQLTIAYANNNLDEMKKQLISSVKLLGLFSSIPIAILIGFGKSFYKLWVPTEDENLLYILTVITCFNLIFALPLEPLYNIFTVKNKIKVSSIALICFSLASVLTVFAGLTFIDGENTKIIYIAAVGAFYSTIRVLIFLPLYGAKCLDFKLTTFYPVILRNVLSVAILIFLSLITNSLVTVDTWVEFFAFCILIAVIGLITNTVTLFSKQERKDLYVSLKKFIKRKGA